MTVSVPLVLLFTDFGSDGPYTGQMEAAVLAESFQSRVVNLISDAPCGDFRRSAYLLAALTVGLPSGCVVAAVVDPGVGGQRDPLVAEVDGRTFLGPDNGLLSRVIAMGNEVRVARIDWRPESLSSSFHGRDLFAPVAGFLSRGQGVDRTPVDKGSIQGADWPAEIAEVIYIDHFGNAMTGLSATQADSARQLQVGEHLLSYAETFSAVPEGRSFWYVNSCGLVEIAVNQGRAVDVLGLAVGYPAVWRGI
jgi:S-adenosylmethionine hydrolase